MSELITLVNISELIVIKMAGHRVISEKNRKFFLSNPVQECTHKEIAKKLDIKTYHIEKILSDLRNRFEATNKSQLVKILSDLNLI